jgi:ABC-2 type transport system permease protein
LGILVALLYLFFYTFAFVGFSNGIAIISRSTGAYHMLLFVLNLPLLFLSNALYPLSTMPAWMRIFAYFNPTTYVVDGLRQSLFGVGNLPAWLNFAVLIAFAALCSWFGLRTFRRLLLQS